MTNRKREVPEFLTCPFTVVVDSNEQAPFSFKGFSKKHSTGVSLPLIVPTIRRALWTMNPVDIQIRRGKHVDIHRVGLADYSILGLEKHIQIERKSLSDLFSTIAGRRGRFEAEIKRLNKDCKASYITVEADWTQISTYNCDGIDPAFDKTENPLDTILTGSGSDDYGDLEMIVDSRQRKGKMSPSVVLGTITSWSMKYRNVHWLLCGNRAMSETITFKILQEFWDKVQENFYPDIDPDSLKVQECDGNSVKRPV